LGLFWAEVDQERARKALRQSLYQLRQAFGDGVIVGRGDDEVGLSPDLFWSDVAEFEAALAREEREEALDLYLGDFLPGLFVSDAPEFENWLDLRRTQLRDAAASAAWALAEKGLSERNPAGAAYWGRRAVTLAPLDERLLRRLIKLLDRVGDRAGAVREYELFARRLNEALELEPSPETRALVEDVRARSHVPLDRVTAATADGVDGAAEQEDSTPPVEGAGTPAGNEARAVEPTVDTDDAMASQTDSDDYREFGGDALRLAKALNHRYVLQRRIGAGGMATVYLAQDIKHDRHVAVKVFEPELAAVIGSTRFLQEIKITAKLEHPHILTLIDSGESDSFLYYVMPYVEGESLREKLRREKHLTLEEAVQITKEVAGALEYAHRRGVIHRDIKPENILIHEGTAIVADFGIALAVRAAGGTRLTQTGLSLGTPSYMSPEQATGDQQLGPRSDVFSLGAVLYEMLVSEPPHTGTSPQAIIAKLMTERPTRPRTLRDTVPSEIDDAVMKALAWLPTDRFASVGEFAEELHPTADSPPSGTATQPPRVRKLTLIAAAAIAVLAVAAVAVSMLIGGPTFTRNRVLISPFENRTGDTTLTVLGDMTADWIAQGLRRIDVVEIVPTTAAMRIGQTGEADDAPSALEELRAAAAEAGAAVLVAGTYYRRGDSLEFQTQIIDASRGQVLSAVPPMSGLIENAGEVVAEISDYVVGLLAANMDPRLYNVVQGSRPPPLEAYREHITGRERFDASRWDEAKEHFYRAAALDSTFFDPRYFLIMTHHNAGEWALADSNAMLLEGSRTRMSIPQRTAYDWAASLVRSDRMAELVAARPLGGWDHVQAAWRANRPREALEGLEDIRAAGNTLSYEFWDTITLAYHMLGEYDRELREARRGREQYPEHFDVLNNELRALIALGQIDEVREGVEESRLLPPQPGWLPPIIAGNVASELRAHGYREVALEVVERGIDWYLMRPADEMAAPDRRFGLMELYYLGEQFDDATPIAEQLAREFPTNVDYRGYLGTLAARRGDNEEARRISESLDELADPYAHGRNTYWRACITAQLGEIERAMMLLRDAYSEGRRFDLWLHRDMDLEPLHDYPPFQEFLKPKG
jgi:DNA-binding SARP family transcriptional activator/tRNA A-37 threonylcarbamoyl transferase component Bud32/TolB-like protein